MLLVLGTRKGAFLYWSDPPRRSWQRSFHHQGYEVHHMAFDPRDGTILADTNHAVYGGMVQRTPDYGASWRKENEGSDYPAEAEHRVRKVWHVRPGTAAHDGRIFAGVERAALFYSDEGGSRWEPVLGLNDHPHSAEGSPGASGLIRLGLPGLRSR